MSEIFNNITWKAGVRHKINFVQITLFDLRLTTKFFLFPYIHPLFLVTCLCRVIKVQVPVSCGHRVRSRFCPGKVASPSQQCRTYNVKEENMKVILVSR